VIVRTTLRTSALLGAERNEGSERVRCSPLASKSKIKFISQEVVLMINRDKDEEAEMITTTCKFSHIIQQGHEGTLFKEKYNNQKARVKF
jgi:hypothetical protein